MPLTSPFSRKRQTTSTTPHKLEAVVDWGPFPLQIVNQLGSTVPTFMRMMTTTDNRRLAKDVFPPYLFHISSPHVAPTSCRPPFANISAATSP